MKKETTNKLKLGIFISLGITMFILAIYLVGERQQLFRHTFHLSGVFRDVSGLQAGNNVRLSGINVGTVNNITIISDTSVRVDILIDESTRKFITKDAIAGIGSEGLMGNRVIIINPGMGGKKEIENNDTVQTVQPTDMDAIVASLKTTIENSSNITSALSKITNSIQSGKGTVGRLLMDQSLARNFDSSIVNLKLGSEGLKNLMDSTKNNFSKNFDTTFANLKEGSAGFKEVMAKARKSWLLWGF
jgi:phospholipid/cholesterol/gamma-HCH transport system substrate-binding protein